MNIFGIGGKTEKEVKIVPVTDLENLVEKEKELVCGMISEESAIYVLEPVSFRYTDDISDRKNRGTKLQGMPELNSDEDIMALRLYFRKQEQERRVNEK